MEGMNILMANYVIQRMSPPQRQEIARKIVEIQQLVQRSYAGDKRQILENLSDEPREVQMQFVALACNNMRVPSGVGSQSFFTVENPYRARGIDSGKIDLAAEYMASRHGVRLDWPGSEHRISFLEMYESGSV
jgi:hypothetical protein